MKRTQQFFMVLLMLLLTVCMCFGLSSCKEEKVQIALRVECEGEIYEFPPDVEEIRVERKYDGKEHYYLLYECSYVNYPEWKDMWFDMVHDENNHLATRDTWYRDNNGNTDTKLTRVKNPGVYLITFWVESRYDFYETRYINLRVIVKE